MSWPAKLCLWCRDAVKQEPWSKLTKHASCFVVFKLECHVQNSSARLVTLSQKYDHVTPILRELHWLPVKYRIMYKTLLLVYKCLHDSAPIYFQELIKKYQPSRNLRSSTQSCFTCSSTSTQYGWHSFSVAASELWNRLPLHVKNSKTIVQFKSSLKTCLFTMAF